MKKPTHNYKAGSEKAEKYNFEEKIKQKVRSIKCDICLIKRNYITSFDGTPESKNILDEFVNSWERLEKNTITFDKIDRDLLNDCMAAHTAMWMWIISGRLYLDVVHIAEQIPYCFDGKLCEVYND